MIYRSMQHLVLLESHVTFNHVPYCKCPTLARNPFTALRKIETVFSTPRCGSSPSGLTTTAGLAAFDALEPVLYSILRGLVFPVHPVSQQFSFHPSIFNWYLHPNHFTSLHISNVIIDHLLENLRLMWRNLSHHHFPSRVADYRVDHPPPLVSSGLQFKSHYTF